MTRGTPKGTKFSDEHRKNMSKARRKSKACQAHYERMRTTMKGRHPKEATASKMADYALNRIGLTRKSAPALFQDYFDMFLKEFIKEPAAV